ncbi:putative 6-phosphogluconolactonase [Lachnellula cervina]|uniref:Putative 6-phosphogluconolactonase n=1 Tax=Lachnellula cervina TaxID=1316786 RepID=A0A7D8UXE5_9HELO|nr:putative 6-phosphogluconolactonase [Lachnellula cervina]
MLISKSILYAMSIATCRATKLYVSSYDGNITTINVTDRRVFGIQNQTKLDLKPIAINNGCAPSPSWLHLQSDTLFCADEGNTTPNKSILASFKTNPNGTLLPLSKVTTPNGNLSLNSKSNLQKIKCSKLTANSGSSTITTISLKKPSALTILQTLKLKQKAPGPKPQQSVPRPHQILLHRWGMFMLSLDLGADLIRVLRFDGDAQLEEREQISLPPGSGPRHAVFYINSECGYKKLYLYLVTEISNMVLGYEVQWDNGHVNLVKIYESSTFGSVPTPLNAAASEILLTPDNKFLIVSSRNDTHFLNSTNPDPANKTSIASDTLLTYSIDPCKGALTLTQMYPAGGSFPRSMSLNSGGDLLAVALQQSSRVVVFRRDVKSGNITEIAGSVAVSGELTDVIWDNGVPERELGDVGVGTIQE